MITSIQETINPAKAQEYLNTSKGNRKINRATVEMYAQSMKNGEWSLTSVPIIFDRDGVLIDGHHRLEAVKLAGVSIEIFVSRGVDNSCRLDLDCGLHRTVAQLIGWDGLKNNVTVAAAVQFSFRLENGLSLTEANATKRVKKTSKYMVERFEKDRKNFIEAANFAVSIYNAAHLLNKSMIAGTYYHLTTKLGWSNHVVSSFFEQACSLKTAPNLMIEKFRVIAFKNALSQKGKLNNNFLYALLIKAFNYYVSGKTVKRLFFDVDNEKYPQFLRADAK